MTFLALIPARGGSKRVPNKNLAPCAGKPLLAWTVEAALASRRLARVLLSTENAAIAEAGRGLGVEVIERPAALAVDDTPMIPVIQHVLRVVQGEGEAVDGLLLLQPTSPLRTARHIDEAIDLFVETGAETVVSVVEVAHIYSPLDAQRIEDGRLRPYLPASATASLRADAPPAYARNGPAILLCKPAVFQRGEKFGEPLVPYVMAPEDSIDIDQSFDLAMAELLLERRAADQRGAA